MAVRRRLITAFPTLGPEVFLRRVSRTPEISPWEGEPIYLSSGRAGAFQAIRHLGIRRPMKVLVPAYHCGVEIEAIIRAGARIVFYPINRNMRVTTQSLHSFLDPNVRALFVVHYWGFPQDMEAIEQFCRKRSLLLIEDCAHALFSGLGSRQLGFFGDAAIFSLPKTLPTPNGGLLFLRQPCHETAVPARGNRGVALKASLRSILENARCSRRRLVAQGADLLLALKKRGLPESPEGLGDFGDTPLTRYDQGASAISRHIYRQASAEEIRSRRQRNFRLLAESLASARGVDLGFTELGASTCPLFCPILVENRDALAGYLEERRVQTFVFGRSLHAALGRNGYEDSRYLAQHLLGLPVHQDLDDADMERIAGAIRAGLRV